MVDGLMQLVGPLDDTARHRRCASGPRLWSSCGVQRCCFAARSSSAFACQYGETLLTSLLGQRVMRDLRRDIFGHVQRLPDRRSSTAIPVGRLVTRVTSDVESLNELFTAGVVAGLGDLFTLARDQRAHARHRLASGAGFVRRDSASSSSRRTCFR